MGRRLRLAVVALGVLAADGLTAQPPMTRQPAEVAGRVGEQPSLYRRSTREASVRRMCGETDPMYTGSHTYLFEYPDIDDPRTIKGITDVRFSSAALIGSGRETDKFHVSVTVSPSQMGGSPPA